MTTTQRPNVIELHGALRATFNHAIRPRELLRITFAPTERSIFTLASWTTAVCTFAFVSAELVVPGRNGQFFGLGIACFLAFLLASELAIQHGISEAFPDYSYIKNLPEQPWVLRRPLMRYAFFRKSLEERRITHTLDELRSCLEFIEINRRERPPGVSAFFRHPLVVAALAILMYVFVLGVVPEVKVAGMARFLATLLPLSVSFLSVGWFTHFLSVFDPGEYWQFECCIRWYYLHGSESIRFQHKSISTCPN